MTSPSPIGGAQRAAILLMSLGEERAAEVMRHLDPGEVQKVGAAMTSMKSVSSAEMDHVLAVFEGEVNEQTSLGIGSDDYLRRVLTDALGKDKGGQVVDRIVRGSSSKGIDALKWMEPRAVADSIRLEHPQIIAIILSHLDPDQAAGALNHLPKEQIPDIIMRIATLKSIQPEAMRELDEMLEKQFSGKQSIRSSGVGGVKSAAEIMNFLDSSLEEDVMNDIQTADEELGAEIQESMFVFDNLIELDDISIQTVLREIQTDQLIVALKGADSKLTEKFLKNMSKRAGETLREDLAAKGPVKVSEVEATQKEIVAIVRRLQDAGEIQMAGKGGEEYV